MKLKKILIYILTIGVILGVIFLIFISNKTRKTGLTNNFVPVPSIQSYIKINVTINSSITQKDFNFPSSLPILQVSNTGASFTQDYISNIASKLGFGTSAPVNFDDVTFGKTFLWSNDNASLTIRPNAGQISYSISKNLKTTSLRPADNVLIQDATNFVVNNFGIPSGNIDYSFINYFNSSSSKGEGVHLSTRANADFYQINFAPKEAGFKTLNSNPDTSPINVTVLPDGTITSANYLALGTITKIGNYPVKDFQTFNNSLKNVKVVSLDDGNYINPDTTVYPITKVTATSVDLVYFIDSPKPSFLQPVFLIRGKMSLQGLGDNLDAVYYLPAFANQ